MTHEIEPYDHHVAGESLEWTFPIVDQSGTAEDLTGASATWVLVPSQGDPESEAVISDADTDVTLSIDETAGEVTVRLDAGVTSDLGGRVYWQRLTVEDTGTGRQIWAGPFPVGRA